MREPGDDTAGRRPKGPQKITRPLLDRLRREGIPGERIFDTVTKGLYVRVNRDRSITFSIMYGDKKRRREAWLGRYLTDFGTLEAARDAAVDQLARVRLGADPATEKRERATLPTFREWYAGYLVFLQEERHKKTWKRDKQYLELALKLFGGKRLTEITERDCEAFYAKTRAQRGDTSANRALASLRACLNRARKKKWIKESPANDLDRRPEPRPRTRIFTDQEMHRIREAAANLKDPHAKAGMFLMLATACRLGEALALKWSDVDLENGRVLLPNPKAGKPQALPLAPSVLHYLADLPRLSTYVVAGRRIGLHPPDKPRRDLKGPWHTVLEKAKEAEAEAWREAHPEGPGAPGGFLEDAHVHDLRRTILTKIAMEYGVSVAQLVGRHASPSTTWAHYIHLCGAAEEIRAPLENVAEAGLARVLEFKR